MKLQGKVALITGAGAEIGRAIARLFVEEGAKVVATDRSPASLEMLAREIGPAGYGALTTIAADVAHREDAEYVIEAALYTYGAIDIVVNNAGITDEFVPVADLHDEMRRRGMDVHLDGPMYICRKAIGPMLAQGQGVIVNVASAGGLFGGRAGVSYTISQHGVIGLTRSLASYYATKGIRCNAVCPGERPEDVARMALYLASDDSVSVNGEMLMADANWAAN